MAWWKLVVIADAGTVVDRDAVLHHVVVTQYCIFVDVAEGADDVVVA